MKKAIGYTRISDQDQSNWSIAGQKQLIIDHCAKNDIELVEIFTDEGKSARNFDRADWKRLEAFVKNNHRDVDLLLVMAWTRFSRNTAEALNMIEMLEKRYHIRVISINEPLHMHPDSPYYDYMRNQIIQNGELELKINRDRTRFGIHSAQKSGRITSQAPRGYINARDFNNQPIAIIDQQKAQLIKEAFMRFLNGETIVAIKNILKEKGMIIRGNSDLQVILQNPFYMGYIYKIKYYDEDRALVKGLHEPIIDEDTWWKVQAIFNAKKNVQRTTISDDFPLRGVLKCINGHPLTAAFSRGRSSLYGYYKCNSDKRINFSANKLHLEFDNVLKEMSLPDLHIQYLQQKVLDDVNAQLASQQQAIDSVMKDLSVVQKKIESVEEKYIEENIDLDTYIRWKNNYHAERTRLHESLTELQQPADEIMRHCDHNLAKLASLHWIYSIMGVEEKQSFVRMVFDNQLSYHENIYRTTFLMDIFTPKALILKQKRLLIYEKPEPVLLNPGEKCPEPEHNRTRILRLMALFDKVKTA